MTTKFNIYWGIAKLLWLFEATAELEPQYAGSFEKASRW